MKGKGAISRRTFLTRVLLAAGALFSVSGRWPVRSMETPALSDREARFYRRLAG